MAILFSGGVDSLLIAIVVCQILAEQEVDVGQPSIDLLNVSFISENNDTIAPDRITGRRAYAALIARFAPPLRINFVEIDVTKAELELQRQSR